MPATSNINWSTLPNFYLEAWTALNFKTQRHAQEFVAFLVAWTLGFACCLLQEDADGDMTWKSLAMELVRF
jgi:hypothetical protein